MITRPVAVARALVVSGVLWALGFGVIVALFAALGADTTIDVLGQKDRVQIVWLGSHAFVVCVAVLVGVAAAGTALARGHHDTSRRAAALVAVPSFVVATGVVALLVSIETVRSETALAMIAGAVIGAAAGGMYVMQTDPGDDTPYGRPARQTGRAWGSR
jgi:hypothetical protein